MDLNNKSHEDVYFFNGDYISFRSLCLFNTYLTLIYAFNSPPYFSPSSYSSYYCCSYCCSYSCWSWSSSSFMVIPSYCSVLSL